MGLGLPGSLMPTPGKMPRVFDLSGRVTLVTGASGHLGPAMAEALAQAGAHVLLNSRSKDKVAQLAERLKTQGLKASEAAFDVTDFDLAKQKLQQIGAEYGRLDVLVNAASAVRTTNLEGATVGDFENSHRVTVMAAFHLLQISLPLLREAARRNPVGASVVNISSMYGTVSPHPEVYEDSGLDNPPFYGAAKAALVQLTRYAAVQLAPERIRVNAISPGCFPSARIVAEQSSFIQRLQRHIPMRRIGSPDELAGPLLFLASDASSYVTGVNLAVDGGWTAW